MRRLAIILAVAPLLRAADPKTIEYGRYLAEEVAKCVECHTPVNESGQLDKTKWLKGKVMEVQPIKPIPNWHKTSPDLTPSGSLWKKWGEGAILKYLQTGLTPSGKPAGPPMPAYKLRPADAEAILEYLKSFR
jgi:mono/diheme cytochrome c family protein